MSRSAKRVLFWTPRLLCLAFAAFTSIFALDVFSEPLEPQEMALALIMHLIPTGLVLVALWIAWRHEWVAAVLFPLLALSHVLTKGHLDPLAYVLLDGPLLLIGFLFWINWRERGVLRPGTT